MERLRIFLVENRKKNNMSQGDLAKKMGYSTSQFISNWERGVSHPPPTSIHKLTVALKVPAKELIDLICESVAHKATTQYRANVGIK
jgi:transcriptional regulator with XRE-family HTH domain